MPVIADQGVEVGKSMCQVAINLLTWNHEFGEVQRCVDAVLVQTFQGFELTITDNGSSNGLVRLIREKYSHNPKIRIVENRENLGYSGGHNRFLQSATAEYVMVLNPDAHLHPHFLCEILPVFQDRRVAAATGKMLRPLQGGERVLDGTGIVLHRTRRARERGQNEVDRGQYDRCLNIFGVSGTAAVFRRCALEALKLDDEYFDQDFFAYSEDLDLAWRLQLLGYEARFAPTAIVFHRRLVSQPPHGLRRPVQFIRHHRQFSDRRALGWRNHVLALVKNEFGISLLTGLPFILVREFAILLYISLLEPKNLRVLKDLFRLLPRMLAKRRRIQGSRRVSSRQIGRWFGAVCSEAASRTASFMLEHTNDAVTGRSHV